MTNDEIRGLCARKREEMLEQYFGNLVHEAAHEKPERVDEEHYPLDLPHRMAHDYSVFLKELLTQVRPDETRKMEEIFDKRKMAMDVVEGDRQQLESAYRKARNVSLWRRITKSNHERVAYYKGLLREYAEELLKWMESDFMEDM